ncbi:hypothetical protein NM688_g1800 [Phlebia brevispora]|uniref:Uncharacterized protein n=1 Tax=Phlebia brevispora TaxID=194682 RepID=A0ACC1TAA0_9APHY|nr:hypothetical protein NM688_g1800 [Phlebia brevispora]
MTASLQDVANKTFDYVIIGGGAAGLTVAARLSEDLDMSVCVLEAGDANLSDPMLLRPAGYRTHLGNKLYDWNHQTTKQKFLKDRTSAWARRSSPVSSRNVWKFNDDSIRGRGLGGSSAINFMAYTKPPVKEIDDFERLGNPEEFVEPPENVQKDFGIKFDEWNVGREALSQMDGDPSGAYYAPNTHDPRTHTRSYATTAHYLPNRDRPNLIVLVQARANRLILKQADTSTATVITTAVEFKYAGQTHTVHVEKEAIVAAGALRSPKLLELSGIGKREVLEGVGVPVLVDLPGVGENMQDHIVAATSFELNDEVEWETFDVLRDPAQLAKQVALYEKGEGVFTSGIINFAFVPLDTITSREHAEAIYKKAQDLLASVDPVKNPGLKEQYEIMVHRLEPGKGAPGSEFIMIPGDLFYARCGVPGKRYIAINAGVSYVFSRGSVHIISSDPSIETELNPHYDECDINFDMFVEDIKFVRMIAATSPMKDLITKEHKPGAEIQTDEQIRDWLIENFMTTWHTTGTCSMLPREKNGVVDPSLKVYGTSNVRVVDFSVVPLHFASHTQSVVYGMAEQAADIIKGKVTA